MVASSFFELLFFTSCVSAGGSFCELGYTRAEALDKVWDDAGSGAKTDFSCWRPKAITIGSYTYKPLGDVAHGSHNQMSVGQMLVAGDVKPPSGFILIWTDAGSGADKDFAVWLPQDPPGYRCLGQVGSDNVISPPPADLYACIPEACVNKSGAVGEQIWTDRGSGADLDFSVYALPIGNGYFTTHDSHSRKGVHTVDTILISQQCFRTGGILQEPCWSFASEAECPDRCSWDSGCRPKDNTCSFLNVTDTKATSCLTKGCDMDLIRKFAPVLMFDRKAGKFCYPNNAGDHYDIRKEGLTERVCNADEASMSRGEVETYFEYEECGTGDTAVTVIMYWWWYGYQAPCIDHLVTEGAHPGDWERIVVLLVGGELRRVQFYQHAGHYSVGDFFLFKGTHPVVYTGKIAHGSYHDFTDGNDGVLGLECMYFADARYPGERPIKLETWRNLVYLDYINGSDWMLPSVNTNYLEDTNPPAKRGTKLCSISACSGTDSYNKYLEQCMGVSCGCGKSCLGPDQTFSNIESLSSKCPTNPQPCLTGNECLLDAYCDGLKDGAMFRSYPTLLMIWGTLAMVFIRCDY